MRSGFTSVARMLPEISIERITVSYWLGRRSSAAGRANATSPMTSASRKTNGGTWRRHSP
jgi:hypothetical protein